MGLEFLRVAAWWRSGGSVEHGPGRDCAGLWIAGLLGLRGGSLGEVVGAAAP
jgi:hypothetical protein